ncbi:MAG: response regulator transcription factor [Verrucomicrobia bacterium]|nr:response regulator transcription factor [Verrucomicrobiota bacterium]
MQRSRTSEKSVKRIVLIDDHPIMRHGLAQLIRAEDGLDVIGEAGSAREGLEVVGKLRPDLAVVDLTLPDKNGLEVVKDIRAMHPSTQCIVLSMHDETLYGERALRAGARGYVMKEAAADHLVTAIHKVLTGGLYVSESLNARMLEQVTGAARSKATGMDALTDRELEILALIGNGVATKIIAAQLSISARTVEAHRAHIKEKLGMTDGAALVRYAVQWVESRAKV